MPKVDVIKSPAPAIVVSAFRVMSCCLLVIVLAQVALPLPWTPVPVTLQTLGVVLAGIVLSPSAAAAALVVYLMLGAGGLPVFAPTGPGGWPAMVGPTGGYLMSFPLAAWLTSMTYGRFRRHSHFLAVTLGGLVGIFVIYFFGAAWLKILTQQSWLEVLPVAVYPFVLPDLAKVAVAAAVSRKLVAWR